MTLGELIVEYCNENKITQQAFAKRIGRSKGYISMLVNNRNPKTGTPIVPTIKTYSDIASAMNMTLDDLFKTIDDIPVSINPSSEIDDDELWQIREDFRRNPELRTIHSLTRNASNEQLKQLEGIIRALRGTDDE